MAILDLTLETLFKAEVILSTVLTIGLLIIAILKKKDLTSDTAKENLRKNINIFYLTLFFLIVPLILFTAWEIMDFIQLISDEQTALILKGVVRDLRIISFAFFDIGLLFSYYVALKMKGDI